MNRYMIGAVCASGILLVAAGGYAAYHQFIEQPQAQIAGTQPAQAQQLSFEQDGNDCEIQHRFTNGTELTAKIARNATAGTIEVSNEGWKLEPGKKYPGVIVRYNEQYAGSNDTAAVNATTYRIPVDRRAFDGIALSYQLAVQGYGRVLASDSMRDDMQFRQAFIKCAGRPPASPEEKAMRQGRTVPAGSSQTSASNAPPPAATAQPPAKNTQTDPRR